MTQKASEALIEQFNERKGDRSFKELGNKLMISPSLLERFSQGQQFEDETAFNKIVAWIKSENPQPPVG